MNAGDRTDGTPNQSVVLQSKKKVDLGAEAAAIIKTTLGRLGEGYKAEVDARRHIVYVSAVDAKAFSRVMRLLAAHYDAQQQLLFTEPVRRNVTVILPTLQDYRKLVPNAKVHGIYSKRNRMLVSISFSNVLIHEFIHALHHNDQISMNQEHPTWIVEGLAMLFQGSRVKNGKLEILTHAGLSVIQEALKKEKAHSLAHLCAMTPRAFMRDARLCYSQARYVMLYLHRLGKLRRFYETYKFSYAVDRTGIKALVDTLGKPLEEIEVIRGGRTTVIKQLLGLMGKHRPKLSES